MAQTFDIRFARSAGFAALFEAPKNRYRWKGDGRLRIDHRGLSIGVKRGLLALFGAKHTQQISNESLRSVYREGAALRVEYETETSTRDVLPFWAGDRDAAAQIVALLPTTQTVELEHSTEATQFGKPGIDWRFALTSTVLAVVAVTAWAIYTREQPPIMTSPSETTVTTEYGTAQPGLAVDSLVVQNTPWLSAARLASPRGEGAIPAFDAIPEVGRSEVAVVPVVRGTPSYDIAVFELSVFERHADQIESEYRKAHAKFMSREIYPDDFAEELEDFERRWWDITFHIYDTTKLEDPALLEMRRVMLGAARGWRNFLAEYAAALRGRDQMKIAGPLSEVLRAQEMRARARKFVD